MIRLISEAITTLNQGGIFLWAIALSSVVGAALTIERTFILVTKYRMNIKDFVRQVLACIDAQDPGRAISLCSAKPNHPVARVLRAGLLKANKSDKEIQHAMEEEALDVIPEIQKRLNYLSMLANVATLMGLLGTISGLIQAFRAVGTADAAAKQELLSVGISTAMYTTAGGLSVAIPCVVAYTILVTKTNRIIAAVDSASSKVHGALSTLNKKLIPIKDKLA